MIEGWYYLHTNGDLLYKRELGGTAADIRESDFARAMWPCDPTDREMAWTTLVEAMALGTRPQRVKELADKWRCDDADATVYADRVGARIFRDGDAWCATRRDFANLQGSPAGFGSTALEAFAALAKELHLPAGKMWQPHFVDLLRAPAASGENGDGR